MKEWNGRCQRCYKESIAHTMSRFNTDLICMDCEEKEKKHPDYQAAADAELKAVQSGDMNFPGIGKPGDL